MAERTLVCWVGFTDLDCARGKEPGLGPIGQALTQRHFDRVTLLSDASPADRKLYQGWLKRKTGASFELKHVSLPHGPMNFGDVHGCAVEAVLETVEHSKKASNGDAPRLCFHVSPGTPVMAAVWIILSKTRFPAELIGSRKLKKDESADAPTVYDLAVPLDISAEYIGELLQGPDAALKGQSEAKPPESPDFEHIIGVSKPMTKVKSQAQKVAPRSAPVLILGESGTGKELFARAIHKASGRKGRFIPVNCGAISENLIESELFGHTKGAFSGADRPRLGHFREAEGGTIFLDELGELPLESQVKLLRVLQEEEIVPVGGSRPEKINVRVIAATNQNLPARVTAGEFREDLFYRLAVAVLELPPLREREGDFRQLVDFLLHEVNQKSASEPGYKSKKLSAGARNVISVHRWPGNVRELYNALMRAAIWSDGETISKEEMRSYILAMPSGPSQGVMDHALGDGFSLEELLDDVSRHYIQRALEGSSGVKTKAAESVGFKSHQRLTDWMVRLGMEDA